MLLIFHTLVDKNKIEAVVMETYSAGKLAVSNSQPDRLAMVGWKEISLIFLFTSDVCVMKSSAAYERLLDYYLKALK